MAYSNVAESFRRTRAVPFVPPVAGYSYPEGWSKWDQLYSEIADHTPGHHPFQLSGLVNHLPSILSYAPKVQREILMVVARGMTEVTPEADGLVKVRGGWYSWRFAGVEAA